MSKQVLIVLEGALNGRLYVEAAQRLGLQPIVFSADPSRFAYIAASGCEAVRVNTKNLDAMIHECLRLSRTSHIAGITSAQESVYASVGKLCQYFELPGPDPVAVERCCDKFYQRQLLADAGIPTPAFRLATSATDVERSAAQICLPVIVKPAVGIGGMGVRLCRDLDELAKHTSYLLSKEIWGSSPRILVEEFAQGPHYSVEIMGDKIIEIGAADFDNQPHFVCREYIYPALLTDDEHRRIVEVSSKSLKALGVGWGPKNIDLRWTTLGPVVIEVNPRLAGTPNSQLVKLSCGIDLVAEHIRLVIGQQCNLRRSHSHIAAARVLLPDREGILDAICGESRAAEVPGITEVRFSVEPKASIVKKNDYRDRIGHVIATSPDRAVTKRALQRAVDLIEWSITPFPPLGEHEQGASLTPPTDADVV
ncbi:ATP-grasp domain-containing protein [Bradyrhizobium arachidis]|uniref:ATP-grasp domain-containing protein n=1 Tax=Bradyrhizobium arachidis TaxID=858423 RepID=A0AAE7NQ82_9BRAD|nr:acetyl-CoA carboxylase biotin carboxylase subunit family protein [Bradyrhizobium arachidis]QOZ66664.1 ATP-grasp domain-containing protein [Bradyrhizobium arachidis]SFV15031.1 Biotin carboxylase [Bradyrhizobium arachidis]